MKSKKDVGTIIAQSLHRKLPKIEIFKTYKKYGIIREKIILCRDFVINLNQTILDTYLGKEYIKTETDVIGHFNWCLNKVIEDFKKEEIYFEKDNNELYSYFFNYFLDTVYLVDEIPDETIFLKHWVRFFKYNAVKTEAELEALMDIYDIFDEALILN